MAELLIHEAQLKSRPLNNKALRSTYWPEWPPARGTTRRLKQAQSCAADRVWLTIWHVIITSLTGDADILPPRKNGVRDPCGYRNTCLMGAGSNRQSATLSIHGTSDKKVVGDIITLDMCTVRLNKATTSIVIQQCMLYASHSRALSRHRAARCTGLSVHSMCIQYDNHIPASKSKECVAKFGDKLHRVSLCIQFMARLSDS